MVRIVVVSALVGLSGCGDAVATTSDGSTGTGTSASVSTTTVEPTGDATIVEPTGEPTSTTGTTTEVSTMDPDPATTTTGEPPSNCQEGGIFTSVAELTAERLRGKDCINGNVWITDGTGPDLWFMSGIRSISGFFRIGDGHTLVSLHGLEALESVGGDFQLGDTPGLADASALANLQSIGGMLEIRDAELLTALALPALTSLGDDLRIDASLTSLAMPQLTAIPGRLVLQGTALTSLAGLSALTSVDALELGYNQQLVELGLTAQLQPGGRLELIGHPALVDIDGLTVTSVNSLALISNAALTSLAPLDGAAVDQFVAITGSPKLAALPTLHGEVSELRISDNPALLSLAGLVDVVVTVELEIAGNTGLVDLTGLGGVANGIKKAMITGNTGLESLDGLAALTDVGDLAIVDAPLLASLTPLAGLTTAASLTIHGTKVQSVPEFAGVTTLVGLAIDGNAALTSLAGLEQLESVGALVIRDNPLLTTLAPLQDGALVDVSDVYDVAGNGLPSCEAKALYDSLTLPPETFCFDNLVDACHGLGGCVVIFPP